MFQRTYKVSGEPVMFKVKKNKHGFMLIDAVMPILMISILAVTSIMMFEVVRGFEGGMPTWSKVASLVEDKCNLADVDLDLANASSTEEVKFISSSNPSAEYMLKTAGINFVVSENGEELCTVQSNLKNFR
jgi:hypothetical protein